MASIAFKAPEWDMEKEEADKIEKASAKFAKHYVGGVVSQKTLDTMQFVSAVGFAYLPRLYLTRERLKEEAMRNARPQRAPVPVAPVAPTPEKSSMNGQGMAMTREGIVVADPRLATPSGPQPGAGNPQAPTHAGDVPFKMPPGTTFPGL